MAEGFIALYRVLLEKPIWKKSTPEQKVILIALLLMANHEESEWEWMGQKFKVCPGQFVTSLDNIANVCGKGISIKNIRTAIERFEKLEFLANKSTKTGRLITILNWEEYQLDIPKAAKKRANRWQTGGKQVATNNNDNNDNNDNNNNNKKYIYIRCQHLSMTEEEYKKLVESYGESEVKDKLEYAENYAKLKNYKSLYKTLNNWLKKDMGKGGIGNGADSGQSKQNPGYDKSNWYAKDDDD